ncbi:MAG: hypothetical protein WB341_17920 [Terracidiphilus sp.]
MISASDPERSSPMLLDTHVLVWSVRDGPRLGAAAKRLLNESARQNRLLVSAITP